MSNDIGKFIEVEADEIRAKRILLLDNDRKTRAKLVSTPDAPVGLTVQDADGRDRISITYTDEGGVAGVYILDRNGGISAKMIKDDQGPTGLFLQDVKGNVRVKVEIRADNKVQIRMYDKEGRETLEAHSDQS